MTTNPPNSPDLAFPIEKIWGIIKPRVKRRNAEITEALKYFLKERNSATKSIIENLSKEYIEKLKKCIELEGRKIEHEHFENHYGETALGKAK